jgi:monoamine oxidase
METPTTASSPPGSPLPGGVSSSPAKVGAGTGAGSTEDFDVVVIGGGIAGLTAIYQLCKDCPSPIRICLLEARDRLGGRIKTIVGDNGKIMDMGATWVGPQQVHLLALLKELDIDVYKQYLAGVNIHDDGKQLRRYTGTIPKLSTFTLLDTHVLLTRLNKMSKDIEVGAPEKCRHAAEWDAVSLAAYCRQHSYSAQTSSLLTVSTRLVLGVESDQISLLYFLHYVAAAGGVEPLLDSENGAQDSRISGGTSHVLTRLVERIEALSGSSITSASAPKLSPSSASPFSSLHQEESARVVFRFSHIVSSVNVALYVNEETGAIDNSITITCQNHRHFTCRRLLMCCPPSCMARMNITPCPPPWLLSMWNRSHAGCWTKVILEYKSAFWRQLGLSGSIVVEHPSIAHERPVSCLFDYCDKDGSNPALVGFIPGNVGVDFASMSVFEQQRLILAQMVKLLGPQAQTSFVAMHIFDWLHDPEARICGSGGCPVDIAPVGYFREQARYAGIPLVLGTRSCTGSGKYGPSVTYSFASTVSASSHFFEDPTVVNISMSRRVGVANSSANKSAASASISSAGSNPSALPSAMMIEHCPSKDSMADEQLSDIDLRSARHSGHKEVEHFLGILPTESGRPDIKSARTCRAPAIYFAGTESATTWIGYMDGAVESAKRAAKEIMWSLA